MSEETTTSTQVDDSTASTEQAVDTTNEQAVQDSTSDATAEDTSSTTAEEPADADNSEDDITEWAKKKGLPMDDPVALAKMVREGDRKVTQASQSKSLADNVQAANSEAGIDDLQSIKNNVAALSFYVSHPEAVQYDEALGKVLEEKPYMVNDLEGALDMAKGRSLSKESELLAARQAGSKEALAQAAQAERSGAPKASASVRTSPKDLTDADIRNMSTAEYQQAKADGKIDPWGPRP